ncbi:hypothetical protein D3C73_1273720 [compost metagenome]
MGCHGHQSNDLNPVQRSDLAQKSRYSFRRQTKLRFFPGDIHLEEDLDVNSGGIGLFVQFLCQR